MSEQTKITHGTVEMVFDFDIVINDVSYPNTIQEDLRLDRTILEEEFAGQSDKYAYYSTLAALAKDQEAKLKRVSELVYAQADHQAREEARGLMAEDPKRKFTEKMYETMAKTHQDYQRAQLAHLNAKHLADKLTKIEHAFAQRKEMLISLGAHARIGATDVKVMGQHVRNNVRKETPIKEEVVEEEIVNLNNIEEEIEQEVKKTRRKPKK